MQNSSKHGQFFQINENTHRRTYSNNIDNIKGLKAGHRRTMSNTAFDFAGLKIQSPPLVREEPAQLTNDSLIKSPNKKKKGFLSLVNAAVSYFKQEAKFPISFPPSEVDKLKEELELLKSTIKDLEKGNSKLLDDCERSRGSIENHAKTKRSLESFIGELKKNSQLLENSLKKLNIDLRNEIKRGEEMVFYISEKEKARTSPQNMMGEEVEKMIKRKQSDVEKPTPKPINYKPLTQRGIRNSQNMSKK